MGDIRFRISMWKENPTCPDWILVDKMNSESEPRPVRRDWTWDHSIDGRNHRKGRRIIGRLWYGFGSVMRAQRGKLNQVIDACGFRPQPHNWNHQIAVCFVLCTVNILSVKFAFFLLKSIGVAFSTFFSYAQLTTFATIIFLEWESWQFLLPFSF